MTQFQKKPFINFGSQKNTEEVKEKAVDIEVKDKEVVIVEKEPTIPVSEVQRMIDEALNKSKSEQVAIVPQYMKVQDENFDIIPGLENFEFKDRQYVLCDETKPPTRGLRTRTKVGSELSYLNPVTKQKHPLFFSRNQVSFFLDKHKGDAIVTHEIFKFGMLKVRAEDVPLQKFLEIHPDNEKNGGSVFRELDHAKDARKKLEKRDLLFDAQKLVREIPYVKQDYIARLMCEDYKNSWSPDEMKDWLYDEVSKRPTEFIKLANDVKLEVKGIAKKAESQGILIYENYVFYNAKREFLVQVEVNKDQWEVIADYLLEGKNQTFFEFLKHSLK